MSASLPRCWRGIRRASFAFEANPVCAEHLAKIAPRNCEVIAKAVSDRTGTTTLRVPAANGIVMDALATIEAANRFESEARATEFVTYEVPTITLDQALLSQRRGGEPVAFINIDVEGHEFAVLKGGEGLIASQRPVLLIEIEYRHGAAVSEVFDWLKVRGYAAHALLDGHVLSPIDAQILSRYQSGGRVLRRMAGDRHAGYINNVFFLPAE
jgi:FkbM family methyltransferase